ncbi:MAG TPA: carboxylesterase family protein [Chthonomonadaceae bacterium]|nr:carboxylesterase family protein [Chthonomonadaceae bacterium]
MDRTPFVSRRELLGVGTGLCAAGAASLWMADRAAAAEGLSKSTLVTEPYVTVETANGKLRGGHSRGALAFKGIPYGGSVSGANRFKPAPPVEPWTGVRDALMLGTPAPQSAKTVYGEREPQPGEECLVLNVWTPAIDGKKRPVLFYNHGGGFSTGSAGSTAQDGGQLAANHDVVVVASNHRLGIMGYLYLGELGGDAYAASGNVGMLDIVEALRWVHNNISAFGGAPHNVTVFGESGGGAKTSALMAMPSAQGLFHKAGVMSGPMLRVTEKPQATAVAKAVLDLLEIPPDQLHKLADLPLEQLLAVQNGGQGPSGKTVRLPGGFGPMLDGAVISQHPFVPAPAPYVSHVPLLIGQNRDEATFFYWENPEVFKMDDAAVVARLRAQFGAERADVLLPVFRRERPNASPVELFIAISTCGMWGGTLAEAESKVHQHGAPVYMYRYDYESNWPIKNTDWTLRAGHATEIQAKFENADLGGLMGTGPDRFQAARNFGEVWTSFARTGHPQATGAPRWPAYDLKTRATMLVDVHCTLVNDPHKAEREIWQATMEKRG